jgi:hypothetical protein
MLRLEQQFREIVEHELPMYLSGNYVDRLIHLFEVGRIDLSLAKLAEAHWDAVAILAEAGKEKCENLLYAVWASEIPDKKLQVNKVGEQWTLTGTKMFCSGVGIVDRALITAGELLIDLDLRTSNSFELSDVLWYTPAFKDTKTSIVTFNEMPFQKNDILGTSNWYSQRLGFWCGALGPAACWGGGAAGLVDYASSCPRKDPHTLAHLAAMEANAWGIKSILKAAGDEVNSNGHNYTDIQVLALKTRHLIEQLCTDTLRRFARAYGPFPLACEVNISRRYHELDLFLRQNHAERDLEMLGSKLIL